MDGFQETLKRLREKGITEEEHGVNDKLADYMVKLELDDADLPKVFDLRWAHKEKDQILEHLDRISKDPLVNLRLRTLKVVLRKRPRDYFHVSIAMGVFHDVDDEQVIKDQEEFLTLYHLGKQDIPKGMWRKFFHPQIHKRLVEEAVQRYGRFKGDGTFSMTSELNDKLDELEVSQEERKRVKQTTAEWWAKEKTARTEREKEERKLEQRERRAEEKAELEKAAAQEPVKHSHELPVQGGPMETAESPPNYNDNYQGVHKSVKKEVSGLEGDELHTYFKKLVGKRAPAGEIRERMSKVTGLSSHALQHKIDEHACRVIRDKLYDNETLVPTVLELASFSAKRACIAEHVKQNTRVEGERISGINTVKSQLKKVLRLSDDEVNEHVNEHIGALLDEIREKKMAEPMEQPEARYVKLYEGFTVSVTNHALEKAMKRAKAADRAEVEAMFRRPGVHIPMVISSEGGHRRIVKYKGAFYTFPFVTDHVNKKFTIMTMWRSHDQERHHYKERLRKG